MAGILFLISAPSGSGKSTLVTQVRSLVEGLDFSVSYTTRAPRGSEEDGREYHFTTRADFERMIAAGEFLEWAEVFGNYYGTALAALAHAEREGKDLLLDIDVQGAVQIMAKPIAHQASIFIMPPSPKVLELRLRNRSQAEHMTHEDVIARRLAEARKELDCIRQYRYAVVNDTLDVAVAELRAIVLTERGAATKDVEDMAATCRTDRTSERLGGALLSFSAP